MALTPHMVTMDCEDPAVSTKFWSAAPRMIAEHWTPGLTWTVLADPGNEFSASAAR